MPFFVAESSMRPLNLNFEFTAWLSCDRVNKHVVNIKKLKQTCFINCCLLMISFSQAKVSVDSAEILNY